MATHMFILMSWCLRIRVLTETLTLGRYFEMHGFLPAGRATDRIYHYLEQNQYQLRSYSVMNVRRH